VSKTFMASDIKWKIVLRDQGPEGRVLHIITRFNDGHYELDGEVISPQNIKAKLGGDAATMNMWAQRELPA